MTSRAEADQQHLIGAEVGRLDDHPDTVGQTPVDGVDSRYPALDQDPSPGRQLGQQRLVAHLVLVRLDLGALGGLEGGEQLLLGREGLLVAIRRRQQHDPVLLADPVGDQAVELLQADGRQEAAHHVELDGDPGRRLAEAEDARVLGGVGAGIDVVALLVDALHDPLPLCLGALQLGGREAVTVGALHLGEQRLEPALDLVFAHRGHLIVDLFRAHEPVARFAGSDQKRRVGSSRDLLEPGVQHVEVESLDQGAAVVEGRVLRAARQLVVDPQQRRRRLRVGGDGEQGLVVIGHRVELSRPFVGWVLEAAEVRHDEALDAVALEVAHRDDRHQVRSVPVVIEALEGLGRSTFEDLPLTDRETLGVLRSGEQDGELLVTDSCLGAEAEPPLLDHHAALLVHLLLLEGHRLSPLAQDLEARLEQPGLVGRYFEHVDGFVEAGVGVDVGTEAHAGRLEIVDQLETGEVLRAVECHVLDEVGQTLLIVVLLHRAGVDDQPQLGPLGRLSVDPDVVGEAVVEPADGEVRIDR